MATTTPPKRVRPVGLTAQRAAAASIAAAAGHLKNGTEHKDKAGRRSVILSMEDAQAALDALRVAYKALAS